MSESELLVQESVLILTWTTWETGPDVIGRWIWTTTLRIF